jgi:alkanesulfonate monooxygenase SsuD/methylene tetrahydromethanopterin reductase-like flavin-dependent oxidoreductase (luciferase family)
MRIGLYTFNINPVASPEFMAELGRGAEERGFSTIWLPEHVVTFDEHASRCPLHRGWHARPFPWCRDARTLDHYGVPAGITSRIRLATGIAILPQRQPL